jgi:hypothetical protein
MEPEGSTLSITAPLPAPGPKNAHITGLWNDGSVLCPFQEKGYMLLLGMTFYEVEGKVWVGAWVCYSPLF